MFLSKIWFFLVALAAAVTLTIALVMPRPAQRQFIDEEHKRLAIACDVVSILLSSDARNRVELAGSFARTSEIVGALTSASAAPTLDEARMKSARDIGDKTMKAIEGRKPEFAMLIDKKGRVVASVALDQDDYGDVVAGRPLIDDALAGYLRDDLWVRKGTMYFVSAAPVIKRDAPLDYVGAVVLGHAVTPELAKRLVKPLDVDLGFYLGKEDIAASRPLTVDGAKLGATLAKRTGERSEDCRADAISVQSGKDAYTAVAARLPGEAGDHGAFYSVLIKQPSTVGFMGTLKGVTKSDLSPGSFPWHFVGAGFVLALAVGIALMLVEADRPLRRLAADAVKLAKGDAERLAEDAHGGKFGSIARSVNIHIDKITREAKTAKKDMDQLLGPAPDGSLGTIDLLATALPSSRPGGPATAAALPPSDFRFNDPGPKAAPPPPSFNAPSPPPRPATPPPRSPPAPPLVAAAPPVPKPRAPTPPPLDLGLSTPPTAASPSALFGSGSLGDSLDDDILGGLGSGPTGASNAMMMPPALDLGGPVSEEDHFKQVFEQFLAVKKTCGEPTSGLTFPKFSEKLVKNRDDLKAKTGCKDVRFTVYVKDGKAALKATPVKDEV